MTIRHTPIGTPGTRIGEPPKNVKPVGGRGTGRIATRDTRDRVFCVEGLFDPFDSSLIETYWPPADMLDVGNVDACVGFVWFYWLQIQGVDTSKYTPMQLYKEGQKRDGLAGKPHSGTETRAVAQYLQEENLIGEYRWAHCMEAVIAWILFKGPVIFGSPWLSNMEETDGKGVLHATGEEETGHAYVGVGYDPATEMFLCQNVWSDQWGEKGFFWISLEDLTKLLQADGEAAVADDTDPNNPAPVQAWPGDLFPVE